MNRIIIAKISEGLGNQLFMYSNAYAISKKFNFDLIKSFLIGDSKKDLEVRINANMEI